MADLEKRLEKEQELLALLMMIFAGDDTITWALTTPSPLRMVNRITELGIPDQLAATAHQQVGDFLREVEFLNDPPELYDYAGTLAERHTFDLANRFASHHEKWLQKRAEAERTGGPVPGLDDLYSDGRARREAATTLTQLVSDTEVQGADFLGSRYGIKIRRTWELDPWSNWCENCMLLSGKVERDWRRIYDGMPPRHPNCRCFVHNRRVYATADDNFSDPGILRDRGTPLMHPMTPEFSRVGR